MQNNGPLKGVRIIDLSSVVMGPYATQILGDYGADVIKVEAPEGDASRKNGPMRHTGMGYTFLQMNRNKRSIVLDLKKPGGLDAFLKLAATVDVVISNVRPRALARLGVGYKQLAQVNPRLILVSLLGFGEDGPYAGKPVYEDLIQGLTAVPSLLARVSDAPPHYMPVSFSDRSVGINAVHAVLAALYARERTGRGQSIQIPMYETMLQFMLGDHMAGHTFEPPLGPPGSPGTLRRERKPFQTRDGYICTVIYNDKHWHAFLKIIGDPPHLANDERYRDITGRRKHAGEFYTMVAEYVKTKTSAEWLHLLGEADIPANPLHTLESVFDDPHVVATGFISVVDHPTEGRIREMAVPSKWSDTPPSIRRRAPRLGEHSAEILREAGLSDVDIDALLASKSCIQP